MRTPGKLVDDSTCPLRKAAVVACLASIAQCAPAAELFPYQPPASSAQPPAQMQPPAAAPSAELSPAELRAIDELASRVNSLPHDERMTLRAKVRLDLNSAIGRRDWHKAAYYQEILRRIGD
jgi:hypothetical protein